MQLAASACKTCKTIVQFVLFSSVDSVCVVLYMFCLYLSHTTNYCMERELGIQAFFTFVSRCVVG
jgi:hypothetical protein